MLIASGEPTPQQSNNPAPIPSTIPTPDPTPGRTDPVCENFVNDLSLVIVLSNENECSAQ